MSAFNQFSPMGGARIAYTTASQAFAIPDVSVRDLADPTAQTKSFQMPSHIRIYAPTDLFFKLGTNNTVAATVNDTFMLAGSTAIFEIGANTFIAILGSTLGGNAQVQVGEGNQ